MKELFLILALGLISSVLKVYAFTDHDLPQVPICQLLPLGDDNICNTFAGTMDQTLVNFCINHVDTVIHNKDQVLDPNDNLLFVLHDGSGPALGNIYGVSAVPYFPFNPLSLKPETIYYISAVAGNGTGPGMIDLNDPCLSISVGTPVIYHKIPTVLADDVSICLGDTATIKFKFTGNEPFVIDILRDGKFFKSEQVNDDHFDLLDNPGATTLYSVTIKDKFCSSDVYTPAKVTLIKGPAVSKLIFKCSPDKLYYTIEFNITNGDPNTYTVTGISGTLNNGKFMSYIIYSGDPYSFSVSDINGCGGNTFSGSHMCNCTTSAGNLFAKQKYHYCVGDTVKLGNNFVKLDSNDIVKYILCTTNNPSLTGIPFYSSKPEIWFNSLTMSPGITYYIFAVAGNKSASNIGIDPADSCISFSNPLQVIFEDIPEFKLSSDQAKLECEKFSLKIFPKFTSGVYYNQVYKYWTTKDGNILNIDSTNQISAIVDKNGTYKLTIVNKLAGCSFSQDTIININSEKPTINLIHQAHLNCHFSEINLDASGSSFSPPFAIKWNTNTGNIKSGDDQLNPVINKVGKYYIEITNTLTGCLARDSVLVDSSPHIGVDTILVMDPSCENKKDGVIKVENISGGKPPYEYKINNINVNNLDIIGLASGTYNIQIIDAETCNYDTLINLHDPVKLTIDLGEDITVDWGDLVSLNASISLPLNELDSLLWINIGDASCNKCLQPQFIAKESKVIKAFISKSACMANDEIRVIVKKKRNIFIPNSFSPNADGINDKLAIFGGKNVIKVHKFEVFDRWGSRLFTAENFYPDGIQGAWNGIFKGNVLNESTYIYFAVIEFTDGETEVFKGDVTLIR